MDIGVVIKKYRKEAGMTQEEMANRLGVTTPAVNKWENGNSRPDIELLAPIAFVELGAGRQTMPDEVRNDHVKVLGQALHIARKRFGVAATAVHHHQHGALAGFDDSGAVGAVVNIANLRVQQIKMDAVHMSRVLFSFWMDKSRARDRRGCSEIQSETGAAGA